MPPPGEFLGRTVDQILQPSWDSVADAYLCWNALNDGAHLVLAVRELGGRDEYLATSIGERSIDWVADITSIVDFHASVAVVQLHFALVAGRWLVSVPGMTAGCG